MCVRASQKKKKKKKIKATVCENMIMEHFELKAKGKVKAISIG